MWTHSSVGKGCVSTRLTRVEPLDATWNVPGKVIPPEVRSMFRLQDRALEPPILVMARELFALVLFRTTHAARVISPVSCSFGRSPTRMILSGAPVNDMAALAVPSRSAAGVTLLMVPWKSLPLASSALPSRGQ
jgi:hypothetical protein